MRTARSELQLDTAAARGADTAAGMGRATSRSRDEGHRIAYAQCWEDADILLEALNVGPGDVCLSIASGGDNTLALLTRNPRRVIAVDQNPAQIACLELRVSAYRNLRHGELLELIGSAASSGRPELYRRCRGDLARASRDFWDERPEAIANGIGSAGRFEHFFGIFRERLLPLIHSRDVVNSLLQGGTRGDREVFYERTWNTWRWRLIYHLFFSRLVMGLLGRDRRCFDYVSGSVARRLLSRTRYALTTLDPAENAYLQWILTGSHQTRLPYALRPENFDKIRANLDRLEWHCASLDQVLDSNAARSIDRFNLSDVFEYMSPEHYLRTLECLLRAGKPGGRLVYWNMLVDRRRPEKLAGRLRPLTGLAKQLHSRDQAFFYSELVIEEMLQ